MNYLFSSRWILLLLPALLLAAGWFVARAVKFHGRAGKLYFDGFVGHPGNATAEYMQERMARELSRRKKVVIVEHAAGADLIVKGAAAVWITGYYPPLSEIRVRAEEPVPLYDAKLTLSLEDRSGSVVWSGTLTPRFWGSRSACDNVARQAASRVTKAMH